MSQYPASVKKALFKALITLLLFFGTLLVSAESCENDVRDNAPRVEQSMPAVQCHKNNIWGATGKCK